MEILKYVAWVLAFGITFSGNWLFEFTVSDPETHRKRLTIYGRVALIAALSSALLAAFLTVYADVEATKKGYTLKEEKIRAENFRLQSIRFQEDISLAQKQAESERKKMVELLSAIDKNKETTPGEVQASVANILDSTEELKKGFPDLYRSFQKATTIVDIWSVAEKTRSRKIEAAFNFDKAGCGFPPFKKGVNISASINTNELLFTVTRSPDSAQFNTLDINYHNASNRNYSWSKGFEVEFEDGSVQYARCIDPEKSRCTADLTKVSDHASLYYKLREQLVESVSVMDNIGNRITFSVANEKAKHLRTLWQCIER